MNWDSFCCFLINSRTIELRIMNDLKAKCDQTRVVRRANRCIVTKLIKEVDKIIGTDQTTQEGSVRLKVILKQLDRKAATISELDREVYSLCEEGDVEHKGEEAELITTKIINYKH